MSSASQQIDDLADCLDEYWPELYARRTVDGWTAVEIAVEILEEHHRVCEAKRPQ